MSSETKKVEDPNGMERLTGESEQDYILRQKRLKAEAQARMKAKFGGSGGLGGGGMQGVGSDSSYDPSRGGYGGVPGGVDLGLAANNLVSGAGNAFSALGMYGRQASKAVTEAVADPKLKEASRNVGNTASGLWSNITSSASQLAQNITESGDSDGLSEFQSKIQQEKQLRGGAPCEYEGFGSSTSSATKPSQDSAGAKSSFFSRDIPGENNPPSSPATKSD